MNDIDFDKSLDELAESLEKLTPEEFEQVAVIVRKILSRQRKRASSTAQ